eukprot:TRINITY_DN263_c0_g1_i4.p1 TRINITY_DN263_c0_g1~~TRINITY_DN263_c0_g1_i4.p1  ORF type:complete len:302 (+),score=75.90 TRINITY_DN263_c0_g1_i4:359-1264(+)
MEPVLSSPKLIADNAVPISPVMGAKYVEKNPSVASSSSSTSSNASKDQDLIAALERELAISKARNTNLERSLADARKSAREREELLLHLQWDPKEDYYAYKNPNNSDTKNLDEKERKMMKLLEQMRIMENTLEERKKENEELQNKISQLVAEKSSWTTDEPSEMMSPNMLSPSQQHSSKKIRVKSPGGTLPRQARSPVLSPSRKPQSQSQSTTPRWWIFKKFTPSSSPVYFSRSNSANPVSPNLSSEYSSRGPGCISPSLNETGKQVKDGANPLSPTLPNHDLLSPAIRSNPHVAYIGQQA